MNQLKQKENNEQQEKNERRRWRGRRLSGDSHPDRRFPRSGYVGRSKHSLERIQRRHQHTNRKNRSIRRFRSERGSGLISTAFGLAVFFLFIFLTMQTLYYLYARASVQATAQELARTIASQYGERDLENLSASEIRAYTDRARFYLGDAGAGAIFSLVDPQNPNLVTVKVTTPMTLRILGKFLIFNETATVRRERKL